MNAYRHNNANLIDSSTLYNARGERKSANTLDPALASKRSNKQQNGVDLKSRTVPKKNNEIQQLNIQGAGQTLGERVLYKQQKTQNNFHSKKSIGNNSHLLEVAAKQRHDITKHRIM